MSYILNKSGDEDVNSTLAFKCDALSDMNSIPATEYDIGDTAYIIATGASYMANTAKEWVLQPPQYGG